MNYELSRYTPAAASAFSRRTSPFRLRVSAFHLCFLPPQQAQITRVRPTAIRPTPPTARPGDSPTPAYWVSTDSSRLRSRFNDYRSLIYEKSLYQFTEMEKLRNVTKVLILTRILFTLSFRMTGWRNKLFCLCSGCSKALKALLLRLSLTGSPYYYSTASRTAPPSAAAYDHL